MRYRAVLVLSAVGLWGCSYGSRPASSARAVVQDGLVRIETPVARFEVSPGGGIRASVLKNGQAATLDAASRDDSVTANQALVPFDSKSPSIRISEVANGKRVDIQLTPNAGLERTQTVEIYNKFPNILLSSVSYKNTGDKEIKLDRVDTGSHALRAQETWTFLGASEKWGQDDVLKLTPGLSRENEMGAVNALGNGGGIPVAAFWNRDAGLAVGHLETSPLAFRMPVSVAADGATTVALRFTPETVLKPGETYALPRVFTMAYSGDYYDALRTYSRAMQDRGWTLAGTSENAPEGAYEVSWCGWGYLENVTPAQMLGIIPKLKEFKIRWATLDDQWFDAYGDWNPRHDTFPGDSIRKMVDEYHRNGIRVLLWWLPLGVEQSGAKYDGHPYSNSKIALEHPDWLVLDPDGKPAKMGRQLSTLCPAVPEVRAYYKQLTEKFIRDWDFDGHKMDNIFSIAPCYNPKHHHKSPQDSVNAMGDVFKLIYDTTKALKPYAVTQTCPCGTTPNLAWLPYLNQPVTADPVGSIQVRRRIKLYKALLGPEAPVYGDHVELTELQQRKDREIDFGRDFASTVGTGGVVGTKFVWPQKDAKFDDVILTPEKNELWKKWIGIYQAKMLSHGEFRNLYLTGFDTPETYVIAQGGKMYYAFFAGGPHDSYKGPGEFRGLGQGRYRVFDYVNNRDLGTVDAARPKMDVDFTGSLLVEVSEVR